MTSYDHLPEIPLKGAWTVSGKKAIVGSIRGSWTIISEEIRWKKTYPLLYVTDGVVRRWIRGDGKPPPPTVQNRESGKYLVPNYFEFISRWRSIRRRCHIPHTKEYYNYGGRGIKMSEEFLNNPLEFCRYLGTLPGYEKDRNLDRIDNNKGYERGNLRWATPRMNQRNRRNNVTVVYQGVEMLCCEFLEKFPKEDRKYLSHRLDRGYTADEAATPRKYTRPRNPKLVLDSSEIEL